MFMTRNRMFCFSLYTLLCALCAKQQFHRFPLIHSVCACLAFDCVAVCL